MGKKLLQILTLSAFMVLGIESANARTLDEKDQAFDKCVRGPGHHNCEAFKDWGDYAVDGLCGRQQGKAGCDAVCKNWGRVPGTKPEGSPPTFRCNMPYD